MIFIAGKMAGLREMREDDKNEVVAWRNLTENARWLIQWEPLTTARHLEWFRDSTARQDANFIIQSPVGVPIGAGSLYGFDRQGGSAEWGRLSTAAPKRLALPTIEGCYFILRFAFELLNLKRVHGSCAVENTSAHRLNEFFGFVTEGRRRRHLLTPRGYLDTFELGLFPDEFETARSKVEELFYKDGRVPAFSPAALSFTQSLRLSLGAKNENPEE